MSYEEERERLIKSHAKDLARIKGLTPEQAKDELIHLYQEAHQFALDNLKETIEIQSQYTQLREEVQDSLNFLKDNITSNTTSGKYNWLFPAVYGVMFGLGVVLGLNL